MSGLSMGNSRGFNPFFKKVSNSEYYSDSEAATYGGVFAKTMYFLFITALGASVYLLGIIPISLTSMALILCSGVALVTAIVSYMAPALIRITGTLYAVAQGYIVGYACVTYSYLYEGIVPLALGLTFLVIILMAILYGTGIIKVSQRMRAVLGTLFLASLVISLVTFISSFFSPVLSNLFFGSGYIAIGFSIIMIIVASLYLAVDFDNIVSGVKYGVAKKSEWIFAFGLVTTVIFLFIRILLLIAQLKGRN